MENFSYNSYPDSGDSSPRSREIDFENPPPWDEPSQSQNYKVKFMCSYGGKIHPRQHDNQLAYIGGETKILAVERGVKFPQMIAKLSALCGDPDVGFKYQLPGEDLDALISVTNDDDLEHMMHEYDRLYRASAKPARMRLFLFPIASPGSFSSDGGGRSERDRFMEALNSVPNQATEKATAAAANNVDFLFGLEKGMPPPPIAAVKVHDPVPEPAAVPPPPEIHVTDRVVGSDHAINPLEIQRQLQELQRLQIREQQEQQLQHHQQLLRQSQQQELEATHRRKSDDNLVGAYTAAGDYYVQKIQEKAPPPTVTMPLSAVQQAMSGPPPGYWPEKHISAGGYPATVTATPPPPEQQVYMFPAPGHGAPPPGAVFHPHAPVVRQMTGQTSQGYYTNVQRIPPDVYRDQQQQQQQQQQPVYNVVPTQPPPMSVGPPPNFPPQQAGMGVVKQGGGSGVGMAPDTGYATQMAYDSGVTRQVYYTAPGAGVVVPPQYQGVGVPVSGSEMRPGGGGGGGGLGPEGKVVVTKVSQASV